jgi:hypothetical protein
MPVDIHRLRSRFEALKTEKAQVEGLWDEIEKYVMPATGRSKETAGEQRGKLEADVDVWDLTAPLACEHLAASLHGMVTSPAAMWLDFEWQDVELERDQESLRYREELARLVWSELQASDFNMEIATGYHELAGLGNMILICEPAHPTRWEGLDFSSVSVREGDFEENSRGGVETFFKKLRWTPVQILDRCARDGKPAPERIRKLAEDAQAAVSRIDVIFCIFRREDVELEAEPPLVAERRPFGSVYFTLEHEEQIGDEGGYYEMPAVVVPWARVPGSKWGFGRGNLALRNVKYLNAVKESFRRGAEKAVDPPYAGTERGVQTAVDSDPGGFTVVADKDSLWALDSNGRFDVGAEVLRDERTEIRRAFHEDDLQLKESPAMTAYETQQRRDLMDRVLGSPVGRLQTGGLVPVVMMTLRHLSRAQKLPTAPALVKTKKAELKVRFRGPISRAQLMDEVVGIEREAAFIASLLKMGFKEAEAYLDIGQAILEHSKRVGAPAAMIRSAAKAKQLLDGARAAEARQTSADASKTEGEAMRAAAQAAAVGGAGGGAPLTMAPQPALVPSGGVVA